MDSVKQKSLPDRSLSSNIALLVITTILCLLAGEAFLRIFMKDSIVLFPRYHTGGQYEDFAIRRMRPNSTFTHTSIDGSWEFRINAQGFRNDQDFLYEKPANTIRVLSLGDSHTEGFEVRQHRTFSAIMERYLNANNLKAEVINAGVSGFSTAEELVFLENEGIKYQPDVVVLGFYKNDFSDNTKAGIFSIKDDELVVKKYTHQPGITILDIINTIPPIRWASENSYLYTFVLNGVWNLAKQILKSKTDNEIMTEYAIPTEEVNSFKAELATKLIERMYKFCKNNNITLIILDIPLISKNGELENSVPDDMRSIMESNSDKYIYSKSTLHEYRDVAEFRVPHGQRHISEFTHTIYGLSAAQFIVNNIAP